MPTERSRISPPASPTGRRPGVRRSSYVLPTMESHYEVEFDNPSSRVQLGIAQNGRVTSANHRPTQAAVQPSPPREKRRSRDAPSLSRVPEDDASMESSTSGPREAPEDSRVEASGSTPTYFGGQSIVAEPEEQEEEERLILDEELARQGIYRGSYFQLLGLYSLTPLFTLLVFILLALLPTIAYPLSPDASRDKLYPYAPCFPFPLPEVITATAFWGLSYLVHSPTFSFFFLVLPRVPLTAIALSSLSLSVVIVTLRQAIIPILLIPHAATLDHPTWRDIAFRRVWWLALGWAAAEAVVGIKQGYEGITLYRDVLVSVRRVLPTLGGNSKFYGIQVSRYGGVGNDSHTRHDASRNLEDSMGSLDAERRPLLERLPSVISNTSDSDTQLRAVQLKDAIEAAVERDVDELIAIRGREELEDLYGMPFIRIPVFISCLHRLNSVLFVLGSTLLVTAAFMRSSLSTSPASHNPLHYKSLEQRSYDNTQLFVSLPLIIFLQWALILLHTPQILPHIGIQTFVYVGMLISLSVFFAGLGVWEGII